VLIKLSEQARLAFVSWMKGITRILGFLSVIAGIVYKLPDKERTQLAEKHEVLGFLFSNVWWILPALLIFVPICEALRRWSEKQSLWPLVRSVLEDFRSRIYPNAKNDPEYAHRVTLFRHQRWVWRWRAFREMGLGWVKIVERTGNTTQNSRTVFRSPNDPDKAEGVAGSTWVRNQLLFVENLPDLNTTDWEQKIALYAKDTNTPEAEIRRRRPKSRSLCGIPIDVKGRLWGVLVIDSRHPVLPRDLIETHYVSVAKHIGRLLERLS
jgi:hypothetical protein